MPWKRKKKMKIDPKKLPEGVYLTPREDEEKIQAAGITDAHVNVSAEGIKLVYWREGEYHEALVPAVLVPSFTTIVERNAEVF